MTTSPASLIIVSRHRPAALMRALAGVAQMDHPSFEVIVVADPKAAAVVRASGMVLKLATFDEANISAARNIGLGLAAAPVVAFLDDDAVPEPTWLSRLTAPFTDPAVTAAGGFVLGRSGLAWQWRAAWVDADGFDTDFEVAQTACFAGTAQRAAKTQGTNCAFRRDDLLDIGGFDPGYAFYLDEADVNLRLAARGGLTAMVPDAIVHHGFAASARRRNDRVPTDLTQIGTSLALFLRRHGGTSDALTKHIAAQRQRLLRHMVSGLLEPRDVTRLLQGLSMGIAQGQSMAMTRFAALRPSQQPFIPLPETGHRPGRVLFGPDRDRKSLLVQAVSARARGEIVTLFCVARGLRAQHHIFTETGIWMQTGGRFGRAQRDGPPFVFAPLAQRVRQEIARISRVRPVSH
ncbi:MAG: GT2 family glycosyltransferase [Pseudorhodobacter sp.]|jgi:GT2 family glycosyltransferase